MNRAIRYSNGKQLPTTAQLEFMRRVWADYRPQVRDSAMVAELRLDGWLELRMRGGDVPAYVLTEKAINVLHLLAPARATPTNQENDHG